MRSLIAAAVLAIAGTPAVACVVVDDKVSWEDQLREEKRIFVGRVVAVDARDGAAILAVDEPIRGIDAAWIETSDPGGSCTTGFKAGQMYIWTSSWLPPTRLLDWPLGPEDEAALDFARSLVEPD